MTTCFSCNNADVNTHRLCLDHSAKNAILAKGYDRSSIITDSAARVVGVGYLEAQAESAINNGDFFKAAHWFGIAACIEVWNKLAIRSHQLMLRSAKTFEQLEMQDPSKSTELNRTLEFSARNKLHLFIDWESELYSSNMARMLHLYETGVHLASPTMLAGTAIMGKYSCVLKARTIYKHRKINLH